MALRWPHWCNAALSLSGLQARGAGVEARDGFRGGTLTARASIKSIFGPEAPPNGRYRAAKGISAELLLHVLPE